MSSVAEILTTVYEVVDEESSAGASSAGASSAGASSAGASSSAKS